MTITWENPHADRDAALEAEPVPTLRSRPGEWALVGRGEPVKGFTQRHQWQFNPNIEIHRKVTSTYPGGATRTFDLYARWIESPRYVDLMSRQEAADHLGITPDSVRNTLRRYGITEQRGYPRDQVLGLVRKQPSRRTTHVEEVEDRPQA